MATLELFNLQGKTALVTGCKRSIGKAMAVTVPIVFLASAASDYVNGEIITAVGGWMGR